MGRLPSGDSATRNRLNALVKDGELERVPGIGRRPSFYYLPVSNACDDLVEQKMLRCAESKHLDEDHQILLLLQAQRKEKQQQIEVLQKALSVVDQDIETISRTIRLKVQLASDTS